MNHKIGTTRTRYQLKDYVKVWCDGSYSDIKNTGAFGFVSGFVDSSSPDTNEPEEFLYEKDFLLHDEISSTNCELYAVYHSIIYAFKKYKKFNLNGVLVFTDSMSAIDQLKCRHSLLATRMHKKLDKLAFSNYSWIVIRHLKSKRWYDENAVKGQHLYQKLHHEAHKLANEARKELEGILNYG